MVTLKPVTFSVVSLNLFKLIKMSLFYLDHIEENEAKSNYCHLHSMVSRVFCLPPLKIFYFIFILQVAAPGQEILSSHRAPGK
jgi:hypothetical protein